MYNRKQFTLENPFDLEANLKRPAEESDNDSDTVLNLKKKRILDLGNFYEGFGWEINVYNEDLELNELFHVTEDVGRNFKFFRLAKERKSPIYFDEIHQDSDVDKVKVTPSRVSLEIAKVLFQNNVNFNNLFGKLTQNNLVSVLITLDYLGYTPMIGLEGDSKDEKSDEIERDLFWSTLARKLSCFTWFNSEHSKQSIKLRREILQLSLKLQYGFRLLYELVQYQLMRDVIITFEGGEVIREIFKNRSEIYGIKILNSLSETLGPQWSPESLRVEEFLRGITSQNDIFDAITNIWQPTLWYLSESKSVCQFSQGSYIVSGETTNFPIEFELYADQDSEGSSTTVNYSMETLPPSPDASLTSITSLGVFAYPKTRCTGFFNCFSARAKFYFEKIFLGEATFDLTTDGIKAFCPIISGGPNKTGLLVTCRVDEFVEKNKEELQNVLNESYNASNIPESLRILQPSIYNMTKIDQITLGDLNVDLKIRFFPLRTFSIYLLYKKGLEQDTKFITNFAFSLQQDVAEWLGTYFTCLWVQISKQNETLVCGKRDSLLSLSLNSFNNQGEIGSGLQFRLSDSNTPNPSTRHSSSASSFSDSHDLLALIENEGHNDTSHNLRRHNNSNSSRIYHGNEFRQKNMIRKDSNMVSSSLDDSYSEDSKNTGSNCYINPMSPGISPFPLISAWFKGVGRTTDSWCIHNVLSEILSDDLIAKHFTDVLKFIQTCESWVDTESLLSIRQHFIHFLNNNKLDSIAGLLFDWIRHIPKSKEIEIED
ncbi:hypothetical protein FG386_002953 [Cryptosporidium ryanae]|uniref:uncharacterized protein n=1 Tax=Cryptosporidium ryanae TaxID=515981 RepID=UPI00351A432B|nr:hypothetical protein FG386_002953 [Cryptosporidium ryanae]